jgi:hypothetical protein
MAEGFGGKRFLCQSEGKIDGGEGAEEVQIAVLRARSGVF